MNVYFHVIFPVAIRSPDVAGSGPKPSNTGGLEEGGYREAGRWYKWADCLWDSIRVGQYQGVPFKFANPDPIVQNHYPLLGPDYGHVPTIDEQPYISWMVRLANAAELGGKSMEFLLFTGPLIWGGQSDFWPVVSKPIHWPTD